MLFISAYLQKKASHSKLAQKLLNQFIEKVSIKETENKASFLGKIDDYLKDATILDAEIIVFDTSIIVDYTSKHNANTIKTIVSSFLNSAKSTASKKDIDWLVTPELISSCTNFIKLAVEKSKSDAERPKNIIFTKHILASGVLLFLHTATILFQDDQTFGLNTVGATAIYTVLVYSADEKKRDTIFETYQINRKAFIKLKDVQAKLLDKLGDGSIDFNTWEKMDKKLSLAVDQAKAKLDANELDL